MSSDATEQVLVIGYGNPLRGDDGLGWHACGRLAQFAALAGLSVVTAHQLTPELAEDVSRARLVIFIDASCDQPPGDVKVQRIVAAAGDVQTHHLDPATLLACARHFFGRSPPGALITVGGASFDLGEKLSPSLEAALPRVLAQVRRLIEAR